MPTARANSATAPSSTAGRRRRRSPAPASPLDGGVDLVSGVEPDPLHGELELADRGTGLDVVLVDRGRDHLLGGCLAGGGRGGGHGSTQALATDSRWCSDPLVPRVLVTITSRSAARFHRAGTASKGGVRDVPGASTAPPSAAATASREAAPARAAPYPRKPARRSQPGTQPAARRHQRPTQAAGVSTGSTTGDEPVHRRRARPPATGLTATGIRDDPSAPSSPGTASSGRMTPWPSSSASTSVAPRFWRPRSPRPGACRAPPDVRRRAAGSRRGWSRTR